MITSVRHSGKLAVWVVSLAIAVWAVNGSSALAKGGHGGGGHGGGHHGGGGHGGAHHGGGGHHAAGHHSAVHHAAVHRGGGHRVTVHHAAAHHNLAHHVAAHHAAVRHIAATHGVGGQGLASRNVVANHRAVVALASGGQVVNRGRYGYGNNGTGYDFGYGAGYGGNGYGRRPWYGGYVNYGYGYGNTYPYVYNQYSDYTPYYGANGTLAASTMADPTTALLDTLGINAGSVVDSTGPGVRVTTVYAGTPAAQAGLVGGDLIRAANGKITRNRDELAQDVANTPANGVLLLSVRSVGDVVDRAVSVVVP